MMDPANSYLPMNRQNRIEESVFQQETQLEAMVEQLK